MESDCLFKVGFSYFFNKKASHELSSQICCGASARFCGLISQVAFAQKWLITVLEG